MRSNVQRIAELGSLPAEGSDTPPELIDLYADLIANAERPITDEKAGALIRLFGEDDCYGVAWSLLHLLETVSDQSMLALLNDLEDTNGWWISLLRLRARNVNLM
jgi:hypothetical protein